MLRMSRDRHNRRHEIPLSVVIELTAAYRAGARNHCRALCFGKMPVPKASAAGVRAKALFFSARCLEHRLPAALAGLFKRLVRDDELRHSLRFAGQPIPAAESLHRVSGNASLIGNLGQALSGLAELNNLVFLLCSHKAECSPHPPQYGRP